MARLSRFAQRCRLPEIMDEPGLNAALHHQALDGLARVNWVSTSSLSLWPPIRDLIRRTIAAGERRPLRVLDVACGGGDVPIRLWRRARRHGLPLEVFGCDFSAVAIEHANERARRLGAVVPFFLRNVLNGPLPTGYDIITCSLFLHHLDNEQAIALLRHMREAAGRMALVNDLARSRTGWWLAWAGTRLLSRSPIVHFDGPVSVAAAFTIAEAEALAQQAGWDGATVRRLWPFRFLLRWERP